MDNEESEEPADAEPFQRLRSIAVAAINVDRRRTAIRRDSRPPGLGIPISPYGWYRVLVYSRNSGYSIAEVLIKFQLAVLPQSLKTYYFHEGGEPDYERDKDATFTFYVDSFGMAVKLLSTCHNPPEIGIRITDTPPNIQVDDCYKEKLQNAIKSRYDSVKRCLNLTRFYDDDIWIGEFCALQQFECLEAILGIMKREMPEMRRLVLDNNHLCVLSGFRGVEIDFARLKSISLHNNELKKLHELRVFEHLHLIELNLKRNPLPENYEEHLPLMFPHLRMLNEKSLGRQKSTCPDDTSSSDSGSDSDVQIVSVSNPSKSSYIYLVPHSPDIQPGIRKFVRHYLRAFDGDKRIGDLERFYHDNSLVTLNMDQGITSWSTPYARQLLSSRSDVRQMFAAWPKTRHLSTTMSLDLTLVQQKMLFVTITGYFKEHGTPIQWRYYVRCFVLTRLLETDDFRIANELIYLGRGENYFTSNQRTLMAKMSAETRLKSYWCGKILQDTNWDYKQSMLAFQTLSRRGQIPEDLFEDGETKTKATP